MKQINERREWINERLDLLYFEWDKLSHNNRPQSRLNNTIMCWIFQGIINHLILTFNLTFLQ